MNVLHHDEVNDQQRQRDDRLRARSGFDKDDRRKEVTNRDALQHAGNAHRREMKVRKAGEKLSEQKDDGRAIENLEEEIFELVAALDPFAEAERDRHAASD